MTGNPRPRSQRCCDLLRYEPVFKTISPQAIAERGFARHEAEDGACRVIQEWPACYPSKH